MKYRQLGATGLKVSEIGFGCWGIGGSAYGTTRDSDSIQALRYALDRGINFFDTSDFYGFGKSEELLGEAFHAVRGKVILASKVGLLSADGKQDFSPKHMTTALEKSLKRLRTDYLDLYQLHNPKIETLEADSQILLTLKDLQKQGKIRAFGISVRTPEDAPVFVNQFGIEVIQVNFNLLDQRLRESGLLEPKMERKLGIIARTPLCFGFLTGQYSGTDHFEPTDHRSGWSPEQRAVWAQGILKFLPLIQRTPEQSNTHIALRFCLSFPGISTSIPGMLTQSQVDENSRASDFSPLTPQELNKLLEVYKKNVFFLPKEPASPRKVGT